MNYNNKYPIYIPTKGRFENEKLKDQVKHLMEGI